MPVGVVRRRGSGRDTGFACLTSHGWLARLSSAISAMVYTPKSHKLIRLVCETKLKIFCVQCDGLHSIVSQTYTAGLRDYTLQRQSVGTSDAAHAGSFEHPLSHAACTHTTSNVYLQKDLRTSLFLLPYFHNIFCLI